MMAPTTLTTKGTLAHGFTPFTAIPGNLVYDGQNISFDEFGNHSKTFELPIQTIQKVSFGADLSITLHTVGRKYNYRPYEAVIPFRKGKVMSIFAYLAFWGFPSQDYGNISKEHAAILEKWRAVFEAHTIPISKPSISLVPFSSWKSAFIIGTVLVICVAVVAIFLM